MLKTFYKFTVVRDPIERLLSAYKDKAYEEFRGQAGEKVSFIFRPSDLIQALSVLDKVRLLSFINNESRSVVSIVQMLTVTCYNR